jgi:hypothetical protein
MKSKKIIATVAITAALFMGTANGVFAASATTSDDENVTYEYEEDENGTYYKTTDGDYVLAASVTLDDSNYQNYNGGTIDSITYSATKYLKNLNTSKDFENPNESYVEVRDGMIVENSRLYYKRKDGDYESVADVTLDENNYQNYEGGTKTVTYSASKYTQVANNTDADVGVKTQNPATGDSFAAAPLIAAAIVSLGTAAGAMVYIKKRKSAKNAE